MHNEEPCLTKDNKVWEAESKLLKMRDRAFLNAACCVITDIMTFNKPGMELCLSVRNIYLAEGHFYLF